MQQTIKKSSPLAVALATVFVLAIFGAVGFGLVKGVGATVSQMSANEDGAADGEIAADEGENEGEKEGEKEGENDGDGIFWHAFKTAFTAQALKGLEQQAMMGVTSSAEALGMLYRDGGFDSDDIPYPYKVEINYDESAKWFAKAMEHGSDDGRLALALLHLRAQVSDADFSYGVKLVEQGAAADHITSLDWAYYLRTYDSDAPHYDPAKAIVYGDRLVALGETSFAYKVNNLRLSAGSSEAERRSGFEWMRQAAAEGHGAANTMMGYLTRYSTWVENSDQQAVAYFEAGARGGDAEGAFALAHYHGEQIETGEDAQELLARWHLIGAALSEANPDVPLDEDEVQHLEFVKNSTGAQVLARARANADGWLAAVNANLTSEK